MLSVVIATQESERVLVPTLAALVPGAVAGVVREVIVADAGSRDDTAQIAEGAGCRLVILPEPRGARMKAGAAMARAAWLLFLAPGIVPDATWIDECRRFIEQAELVRNGSAQAAVFRKVSARFRPMLIEAFALLRAAVTAPLGAAGPNAGEALLIAKPLYQELGGHLPQDDAPERALVRRLGRRRLALLRTGAMAARDGSG
jgi:glycosyltransferase involved in cell wall biosynthesis